MNSGKDELCLEMVQALFSALYETFPEVPPYSYMFLYGACSVSGFMTGSLEEIKEK